MAGGAIVYFVLEMSLYLSNRPGTDATFDAVAPLVVAAGGALSAFLIGSGFLLLRLLRDREPERSDLPGGSG